MEELGECELGQQDYWDKRYQEEIKNYNSHGDVGEIWFGEDIVDRIIRWMNKTYDDKSKKILDVGCGNGMLLIEFARDGYTNLTGVDYSVDAINLAKKIAEKENLNVVYHVLNLLEKSNAISNVDLILDKGTYDAISLSSDAKINRNLYIDNIHRFLNEAGRLVITSCNWTHDELIEQFREKFDFDEQIPTPQFKFGGKVGNVVSTVVFKKKC